MFKSDDSIESAKQLLVSGDEEQRDRAFDELYHAWSNHVASIAQRRCPGLTTDRVWDVVHLAFLKLYADSAHRPFDLKNLERDMTVLTKSRAIDALRKQTNLSKWKPLSVEMEVKEVNQLASGLLTAAEYAENSEFLAAVRTEIAAMSARQRHVAELLIDFSSGRLMSAKELHEVVRDTDGGYLTHHAVVRARQEVIKKLEAVFIRFNKKSG